MARKAKVGHSSLISPDVRDVPVYVYLLRDPESLSVVWVGRTSRPASRHAALEGNAPKPFREWRRGLHARGLRPMMEIIEVVLPGADSAPRERHWMRVHATAGTLFNITLPSEVAGRKG